MSESSINFFDDIVAKMQIEFKEPEARIIV